MEQGLNEGSARDLRGRTPLHLVHDPGAACGPRQQARAQLTEFLLTRGGSFSARDNDGNVPSQTLVDAGE